jgi:hypothetical protein
MIGAAIMWMIMSSPIFLAKKLNLKTNPVSNKLYRCMFYCGAVTFIASIAQMIYNSLYWNIVYGVVVLFMGVFSIKTINDWRIAQEVMDEITREEK